MSAEKPLPDINFFVCSTYEDLKAYRAAVIKNISSHAGVINAQEFFGARDQKPLATCLEEVDKSHVFIMFLGPRYGTVDSGSGQSFVQCEYERARERGIPRFAYLMDKSHPFPIEYVSVGADAEQLEKFKRIVQTELTVDSFTTPDDLAKKVYGDLVRELPKKGFKLGKEELPEPDLSASIVLPKFLALPKLFHGRNVKMRGHLGKINRASNDVCDALSYRYGAAIARRFEFSDKGLKASLGQSLSEIFASEEKALELMNAPNDKAVDLLVKTVQGEYEVREPIYGYENEPGLASLRIAYFATQDRRRVVTDYQTKSSLICGLELVELMILG
jgi:hypothetical protein